MTDHTAIIERTAEEMWQTESVRAAGRRRLIDWSNEGEGTREKWRGLAQAALTASGLLEVMEKAEAYIKPLDKRALECDAVNYRLATYSALRTAIKGVRDGK